MLIFETSVEKYQFEQEAYANVIIQTCESVLLTLFQLLMDLFFSMIHKRPVAPGRYECALS